ncbi:MAG: ABC transporter permease, partial [Mesorhizobium sp.]
MAERSPATRRTLWLVLSLVFAFLYIPIVVLVALS